MLLVFVSLVVGSKKRSAKCLRISPITIFDKFNKNLWFLLITKEVILDMIL